MARDNSHAARRAVAAERAAEAAQELHAATTEPNYQTPAEDAGFRVLQSPAGKWTWVGDDADPSWRGEGMDGLPENQVYETEAEAWKGCCDIFELDPY